MIYRKPLSRITIAEKLNEIENNKEKLNDLERKELEFYYRDFAFEINQLKGKDNKKIKLSYFKRDMNKWVS